MRSIALAAALALGTVVVACSGSGSPSPSAANPTATVTAAATAVAATPTASPSGPPTVGRCDWPESDLLWEQLPPQVKAYTAGWADRNAPDRLVALQDGMTDDASFVDSTLDAPIVGPEALSEYIGHFLAARPGHYFAMRELIPADHHNGHIRLRWMLCNSSAQPVLDGEEIATLDANGRVSDVIRFLDNP